MNNETRQHNSFNEIIHRDDTIPKAILSDKNGNETDDGNLIFQWDYKDRLRTVTRKTDGLLIASYGYDARNRRLSKTVLNSGPLNGSTSFYLDAWQEIEERDGADNLLQQYIYGNYIDEPLVLDHNAVGDAVTKSLFKK